VTRSRRDAFSAKSITFSNVKTTTIINKDGIDIITPTGFRSGEKEIARRKWNKRKRERKNKVKRKSEGKKE